MYKAEVTYNVYFIGSSDQSKIKEHSYRFKSFIDDAIQDLLEFDQVNVEAVNLRRSLDPQWQDTLPYIDASIQDDPLIDGSCEITCLQALRCTGVDI